MLFNYAHVFLLWNMKVTVTPIGIGALKTIPKGLIKGLEDLEINRQVETIQTTTLLRSEKNTEKSPGHLRRLVVTQTPWEALLSLKLHEKPSANVGVKKKKTLKKVKQHKKLQSRGPWCLKQFCIIWEVQGFSEILISFRNLITWPILVQRISIFYSVCWNNLKFYI